ncbi:hypothetical protein IFHNHDMJ_00902 [Synechococcus sp. CBW1107]|nr:hypothetical protein IFHNHDMJ_00902 [Synechococcus sp. CBW1107]
MNPLYRTATFRYGHYRRSTAVEGFPSADPRPYLFRSLRALDYQPLFS